MTGAKDQGFAILVLRDGVAVGIDLGGVKFDGTYAQVEGGFDLRLRIEIPPNSDLIQGVRTGAETVVSDFRFTLPANFLAQPFMRIEAPHGPLNARITKMRDLND